MRKRLLVVAIIFMLLPLKNLYAVSNIDEQIQAIMETAEAYFSQGEQVQYDSYRKTLLATPEDATSQHYVYTVCSGFTYQTYYQTLGIEIPDTTEGLLNYAEKYKSDATNTFDSTNNGSVLLYYGSSGEIYSGEVWGTEGGTSNCQKFVENMCNIAKPGDILVVTRACNDD